MPPQVAAVAPAAEAFSRDTFFYTAEFLPLAPSVTQVFTIQITGDSDYLLRALTGTVKSLDADNVEVGAAPAVNLLIVSSTTGRILMDRPIPWAAIVGSAQRPYYLEAPKTFGSNSAIRVEATNLSAAALRVRLVLHGYKRFPNVASY